MGSKLFTIITSLCFTTILLAEDITEKEYIHVKYMESLVKKANEKKLYEKEYWRIIVHYEKNWAFITESQVDDPNFFMSPEGKHNPQAELDATIRGFFLAPDEVKERRDHPLERFPLRFKWLCKELNIDKTKTAYDHPKIIQDFIDDYEPDYIKLVFPSAYINSPASMFGHTLIIIKSKKKTDFSSISISWAARAGADVNSFIFAFKGLVGGYKGVYENIPYYIKLQLYSDMSQRDIWEYKLNFNKDEVENLIYHLRELEGINTDYYFFTDNCAYDLLFLFEAARPSEKMTEDYTTHVIPIDIVRTAEDHHLIESEKFRPSRATQIQQMREQLPPENVKIAQDAAETGDNTKLEAIEDPMLQAKTYDLAITMLKYNYNKRQLMDKQTYQKRFFALVRKKNKLPQTNWQYEPPISPHKGHETGRISYGIQGRNNGHDLLMFSWTPAYHELIANQRGYQNGAEIQFLDTWFSYDIDDNEIQFDHVDFLKVTSLGPRDDFFKPYSWQAAFGVDNEYFKDYDDINYEAYGQMTFGLTYATNKETLVYGLTGFDARYSGYYKDNFAGALGGKAGILSNLNELLRLSIEGNAFYYSLGDEHGRWEVRCDLGYALTEDTEIRTYLSREKDYMGHQTLYGLQMVHHF